MVFRLWISLSPVGWETASVQSPGRGGTDRRQMLRQDVPGVAGIAAGDNRVLTPPDQLFPFWYLSDPPALPRHKPVSFSRFSKPWRSFWWKAGAPSFPAYLR